MLDKLKQLTKDTAVYGISTILGRFLNFLLVPLYTNVFTNPSDYGVISNYYAFIGLLNILFLYGMDSAFIKFSSLKEIGDEKDNFSTPFLSVLFTSLLFGALLLLFKNKIAIFLGDISYSYLVYYTVFILIIDSAAVIPFIKLRLQRKAKKFSLFKILNILLNIILNLLFILKFRWGIESVFIANIAASALSLILLIPDIIKDLRFSINKTLLKRLLKFGIPYLPAGIGAMIVQVIDRPILQHLTDLKTVGIYQANYKLGIFMMLFVSMFQFAWQPFFMQNAKEKDAKSLFSKVLTYFTLTSCTILIVLSLFVDNLVKFSFFHRHLIGVSYWSGLPIVPIILAGYLFNGIYIVFTAGIFIKEKSIYVPFIIGFAAIINIVVNLFLIPVYGIMGAAFATLFSYLFMAIGFYFVTQRFYPIKYENSKIIITFLITLVASIFYYVLLNNQMLTLLNKFIILIAVMFSFYSFVLDKKEKEFIKKRVSRG